MKVLTSLIAAVGFTAAAFSAQAADLPSRKGPPLAPVFLAYNWTGFYVGIQGGYQWGNTDGRGCNAAGLLCNGFSNSPDGFVIGGHVGYNFQFNQFVLGLEGDLEYSDMKGTTTFGGGGFFHRATSESWQGSIRARAGVAFDRLLIYATGGFAFAEMDYAFGFPGFAPFHTYGKSHTGWTIGGGLEYALTNNITARAEYRYTDYGSVSNTNLVANSFGSHDYTTHTVRVGVSYKF